MTSENTSNIIETLKNHKSNNGVSLYEHISQLLTKLMHENSDLKQFSNFEILSNLLKKNHFLYQKLKSDFDVNHPKIIQSEYSDFVNKCFSLIKVYLKNN